MFNQIGPMARPISLLGVITLAAASTLAAATPALAQEPNFAGRNVTDDHRLRRRRRLRPVGPRRRPPYRQASAGQAECGAAEHARRRQLQRRQSHLQRGAEGRHRDGHHRARCAARTAQRHGGRAIRSAEADLARHPDHRDQCLLHAQPRAGPDVRRSAQARGDHRQHRRRHRHLFVSARRSTGCLAPSSSWSPVSRRRRT